MKVPQLTKELENAKDVLPPAAWDIAIRAADAEFLAIEPSSINYKKERLTIEWKHVKQAKDAFYASRTVNYNSGNSNLSVSGNDLSNGGSVQVSYAPPAVDSALTSPRRAQQSPLLRL